MSKYDRVYNFSAGPSVLPLEVLEKVQRELLNYDGTGESVMEMSHRSAEFQKIIDDAEKNLRDLMNIPDDYYVLFLQGGGTLQFSMVPMNLMRKNGKADYVITGNWAKKAFQEAQKFGDAKAIASSAESNFSYIPKITKDDIREDADYVYICTNNTIYGTHYNTVPDVGDKILVADMSSCILSEEVDVNEKTPIYLDYATHAKKGSMYNTPPCFSIYVAGEVFKYIKSIGGVAEMHRRDVKKAGKLYDYLDQSKLFKPAVAKEDRSLMNVTFVTGDPELDKKFVAGARERGMINLAGHRSVGGMRASIYNAMPEEGVDALIAYMKQFEDENL